MLTDAELVGRYAEHRDAAAFEVLVWRHGPMVWAAARRVLRHQQDVEDAFQATFLALAKAAGTLGTRQAVAGWLHRVAMNAAINLKARRRPTGLTHDLPAPPDPDGELSGALDEELQRLPDRVRAAFVLCCLEGMTSAEAARELGCPVGTVDSRLHAARARLRERLTRRGLGPTAVLVAVTVPSATAGPPPSLVVTALCHATAPGTVPNDINLLATGVLKAMTASKLKSVAALLAVALLVGGGLALTGRTEEPGQKPDTRKDPPMNALAAQPPDEWSEPVNGLRARVVLVGKPRSNGTRMLHPYLELRNVSEMAYPLRVRFGGAHVKFELVDADGKVVDDGRTGERSGSHPDPGTVSLPHDSTLRVGMHCTNWGIPRGAAAMIATDSGAWVLKPGQEGKVFLRATVSGKRQDGDERVWFGEQEARAGVTWSGEALNRTDRPAAEPERREGPGAVVTITPRPVRPAAPGEKRAGLLAARLTVNDHGIDPDRRTYSAGVEVENLSGHAATVHFDPKNLKLELLDADGRVIAEGLSVRSGPVPIAHDATVPTGGYVGLSTYRGGIASGGPILFAAGFQDWSLRPGTYRLRGAVTVTVKFGEDALDPLKPDVPPARREARKVSLELAERRFELTGR